VNLPLFDFLLEAVRAGVALFDAVLLLGDILLRPNPVRCEEYLSKRVQKEHVWTVIVTGIDFLKLS
jgi:hypothetical protein